jgi:hypothetical protein
MSVAAGASLCGAVMAQPPGAFPPELNEQLRRFTPAPVLRWQRPDPTAAYSRYGVHPAGYGEGENADEGKAIRFAGGDPFSDPFGDRVAQQDDSAAPFPLNGANPETVAPAPAAPMTPELSAPQPEPLPGLGQGQLIEPSPSNGRFLPESRSNEPACDRIYNDRNCCQDAENCQRVRDFLKRMRISDISVDITPGFRPEGGAFYGQSDSENQNNNAESIEDSRNARLALAGPRTWRDQQGNVVAEGRWTDYRFGRVYVSTGDGQVVQLPVHELSDDDLCFVNAWWNLPSECTLADDPYLGRQFVQTTFTWKASALCHKPLYFEELQLERYGHTAGPVVQPFLSGAHFFASIAFLPYKMGINPPNECIYQLGLYRPGSCAPWLAEPFPISLRGALLQSGAVLGGVYLIP